MPNVLFIAVDDLRPTIGCYGDTKAVTPNLDRLAAQGVVFTKAYCQQAVCNPSRASVMTGLRPDQIRVTDLVTHFRDAVPNVLTLPQAFSANGYEAIGIGKIYHGGKKTQDEISWTKPSRLNLSVKKAEYALPENKTGQKAASYECAAVDDEAYEDGQIAREAIRQLRELKQSDKPFFLAVGFKKPHLPFCAPEKYWNMYHPSVFDSLSDRGKPVGAPDIAFHHSQELRGYADIPQESEIDCTTERALWHGYYASVSFVDEQIGKLLNTLKELNLEKNTIIVLWGDHGYHLGEQELWCKSTNFELDCRIPLIISAPGVSKPGSKSEALVEAVDIYPTLLDLCSLQPRSELAGMSTRPVLANPSVEIKEAAFSQFVRPYGALMGKPVSHMGYSVRTKDWRYTGWYNAKNDSLEFTELYHLKENRIEKKNDSGEVQFSEIEADMLRLLEDYKNGK
ncbi:sulfatase [Gaoshiqia sp. Z1-71]|uniref:sulfatase n=1 Tax=Gaoshiqia hydrogeniformans TaxID=3290090 RepID=UPI003BF9192B